MSCKMTVKPFGQNSRSCSDSCAYRQTMKPLLLIVLAVLLAVSVYGQPPTLSTAEYKKADSIATLYPRHSLLDLRGLSHKLTTSLSTEAGRFRAIYTWVCLNIDNDFTLYQRNKRKREKLNEQELLAWNKKFTPQVFKTLIKEYSTVCTGYAYLIRELALHAGLSCEIVDGYGRTSQANVGGRGVANHSWNAVQLNGHWYLCDATWSSGAINMETATFVRKFDDVYFLADPAFFVLNHYPLNTNWTLLERPPTLEAFLSRPLIYVNAIRYRIQPQSPSTFEVNALKGELVSFNFHKDGGKPIGDIVEFRLDALPANTVVREIQQDGPMVHYSADLTFAMRGTYAVHLAIDDLYIVTYKVIVK